METIWSCSSVNVHFVCLFHSLLCEGLSPAPRVSREVEHQDGELPSLMTASDLSRAHVLIHHSPESVMYWCVFFSHCAWIFYYLFHKCSLVCLTELLPLTPQILWCFLLLICAILEKDLFLLSWLILWPSMFLCIFKLYLEIILICFGPFILVEVSFVSVMSAKMNSSELHFSFFWGINVLTGMQCSLKISTTVIKKKKRILLL